MAEYLPRLASPPQRARPRGSCSILAHALQCPVDDALQCPMDDALQCPVCLTLPEGEVHQCHNGHCYCVECWHGLRAPRRCPECRQPLPQMNRSRAQEERIAALPAHCNHCGEVITRGAKAAHESACQQRPTTCMGAETGCGWVGAWAGLAAHEATCPFAGCQRLVALLQAQNEQLQRYEGLQSENQQLQAHNRRLEAHNQQLQAALEPLHAQNQQLQQRVATLEPLVDRVRALEREEEAEGGRRRRRHVGPAAHDPPPSDEALARMGLAEVVAALRTHTAVARLAKAACGRLVDLCGEAGSKQRAADAEALEATVEAMRAHPAAATVQEQGCWVLANVCSGSDAAGARLQRAAEAGALEAAVAAMRAHPQSAGVQAYPKPNP